MASPCNIFLAGGAPKRSKLDPHAAWLPGLVEADFDRVIRVNLKGVFLTGQAAARQMAE